MKNETITKGFVLAGAMNGIGVLANSRFFTNTIINEVDPEVMSNFGLLMIITWGFAYIAVAKDFAKVKWLVAVFAIEKLIYGVTWTNWILENNIAEVFEKDTLAGVFYSIYGINDWLFFIFFTLVFIRLITEKK